jgi:hypothetical protein
VTPAKLYLCHRNLLRTIVKNCGSSSLGWALRNYLLFSFLMLSGFLIYEPKKGVKVIEALVWNLRNLRTAYASRLRNQSRRKVTEREILVSMYPNLPRMRLTEHAALQDVLNLVFDYGNRNAFQTYTKA